MRVRFGVAVGSRRGVAEKCGDGLFGKKRGFRRELQKLSPENITDLNHPDGLATHPLNLTLPSVRPRGRLKSNICLRPTSRRHAEAFRALGRRPARCQICRHAQRNLEIKIAGCGAQRFQQSLCDGSRYEGFVREVKADADLLQRRRT